MRVLGAEAREDDARLVGLAVAVGVLEVQQLGAVGDVGAAVARLDAGRDQQAVGEDGGLVGPAVAVAVFEDQDLVVGDLARLDLRIDLGAGDPEPARGVEVHLDRLGDQRVGREQVDLEAVGDDERLALDLRVGIGDREGCPLPVGAGDRHQHDDRRGEYEVSHRAILGDEDGAFKAFGPGSTLAAESDPVPLPGIGTSGMGPGTTTDRELGFGAVSRYDAQDRGARRPFGWNIPRAFVLQDTHDGETQGLHRPPRLPPAPGDDPRRLVGLAASAPLRHRPAALAPCPGPDRRQRLQLGRRPDRAAAVRAADRGRPCPGPAVHPRALPQRDHAPAQPAGPRPAVRRPDLLPGAQPPHLPDHRAVGRPGRRPPRRPAALPGRDGPGCRGAERGRVRPRAR